MGWTWRSRASSFALAWWSLRASLARQMADSAGTRDSTGRSRPVKTSRMAFGELAFFLDSASVSRRSTRQTDL